MDGLTDVPTEKIQSFICMLPQCLILIREIHFLMEQELVTVNGNAATIQITCHETSVWWLPSLQRSIQRVKLPNLLHLTACLVVLIDYGSGGIPGQ